VPRTDLAAAAASYRALAAAHDAGLLRSAHVVGRGGLAVALAHMAMAGELGLAIELGPVLADMSQGTGSELLLAAALFGESTGRVVLTCAPGRADALTSGARGSRPVRARRGRARPRERRAGAGGARRAAATRDGVVAGLQRRPRRCSSTTRRRCAPPSSAGGIMSEFTTIDRAGELRVLVLTGYGLNCEAETAAGFRMLGAQVDLRHLADLQDAGPDALAPYRLLAFIGGFSFGDHIASGRVYANRLRHRLGDRLQRFVADGGLCLGICNGFQTLVKLGLLPGDGPMPCSSR
jgi:putative intracellular protease/amidase